MSDQNTLIVSGGTSAQRQQVISLLSEQYHICESPDAETAAARKERTPNAVNLTCAFHPPEKRAETTELSGEEYLAAAEQTGLSLYRYIIKDRTIFISKSIAETFSLPTTIKNAPDVVVDKGVIAPQSVEEWLRMFREIDSGQKSGHHIVLCRKANGIYRYFEVTFAGIRDADGNQTSAVIQYQDITDSREREKMHTFERSSMLEALSAIYTMIIAVNLTKNDYNILMYEHFTTRKVPKEGVFDELITIGASTVPEQDRAAFIAAFSRENLLETFSHGQNNVHLQHRQIGDDGLMHWTETVVLHVPNTYDSDVLELTLARCIDEQKADEEKLRKSLDLASGQLKQRLYYTDLINAVAPELIIIGYDDPAIPPFLVGNLPKMLGYSQQECIPFFSGKGSDAVIPEDALTACCTDADASRAPMDGHAAEYRIRKKDGQTAYIMATGTRFSDQTGTGYVRVMTDHTEQHRMAERIRIIEEEARLTMLQMDKTVCRYDVASKTLSVPESYARRYALPLVLDMKHISKALLKKAHATHADIHAYEAFLEAIHRGDPTGTAEFELIARDGSHCWKRASFQSVFDENGLPVRAVISIEDTTEQHKQADENARIRESERILRAVAEHSARIVYHYDIDRREARALNAEQAQRAGLADRHVNLPESMIRTGAVLPDSATQYAAFFDDIHAGKENGQMNLHIRQKDGTPRWFDLRFSSISGENGRQNDAVLSYLDITARHEEEISYARYRQSIQTSEQSTLLLHVEVDITSDLVENAGGRNALDVTAFAGTSYTAALTEMVAGAFESEERSRAQAYFSREHLLSLFADGIRETHEDWQINLIVDQQRHWVRVTLQFVTDPYTSHVRMFALVRDVTREKKEQMAVVLRAERDGMTGLLNRATTEASIREWLGSVEAKSKSCMMIILDLDGLKQINDTFGHAQGDRALIGIAETLRMHFRSSDIIGRAGGDEFLIFLTGVADEATMSANVLLLLRKISQRTVGARDEHQVCCSAGCAIGAREGETFESLFAKVDTALYHVKRSGRNDFAFYTPRMQLTDYRYERHAAGSLKNSELFDPGELKQLIRSLSTFYPLVLSVNLDKNSMYTMESDGHINSGMLRSATVDEFVTDVVRTIHPDDRAAFSRHISREALQNAYHRGLPSLHFFARQEDDAGQYQWVEVIILFYRNEDGDACEFTLARASEEKRKDQELLSLHKLTELAVSTGFEYVCLVHLDSGAFELYGNDGKNTHTIPKRGDFDEATRLIRDTHVVSEERETYYDNAVIAHVVARMKENGGKYSYCYTLTDGVREAAFYYFELTHSELLMTVRRVDPQRD